MEDLAIFSPVGLFLFLREMVLNTDETDAYGKGECK